MCQPRKQVADFIIKTERICEKRGKINNLRSLTFSKNNIEKNVKEWVLFNNYKERFKRSLHLCLKRLTFFDAKSFIRSFMSSSLSVLDSMLSKDKFDSPSWPHDERIVFNESELEKTAFASGHSNGERQIQHVCCDNVGKPTLESIFNNKLQTGCVCFVPS